MKTATKEITVIARAQFKNNLKAVLYRVLSSNGHDEYTTTVYDGKAASCTCPATKPCYHMVQCEALEAARMPQATKPVERALPPLNGSGNREFSLYR